MPQAGYSGQLTVDGNELCEVQDATLNLETTEIETTNRCDNGCASYIAGISRGTVDMTVVWKSSMSTAWVSLETAYLAKGTIAVQFLDEDGEGYSFTAMIPTVTWNQPQDDAQTLSVTLRLTTCPTKVSGTS